MSFLHKTFAIGRMTAHLEWDLQRKLASCHGKSGMFAGVTICTVEKRPASALNFGL